METTVPYRVINEHSYAGWITLVVEGRLVEAKVYDEPSIFGVNDGRVSKIAIGKTDSRDYNADYFDQMSYNYDRGLDFHDLETLSEEKLSAILEILENLPQNPTLKET